MQQFHCATASCRMNGDDWMKHFINHILHLSHSQWIFRNITLHHRTQGGLCQRLANSCLSLITMPCTARPLNIKCTGWLQLRPQQRQAEGLHVWGQVQEEGLLGGEPLLDLDIISLQWCNTQTMSLGLPLYLFDAEMSMQSRPA